MDLSRLATNNDANEHQIGAGQVIVSDRGSSFINVVRDVTPTGTSRDRTI